LDLRSNGLVLELHSYAMEKRIQDRSRTQKKQNRSIVTVGSKIRRLEREGSVRRTNRFIIKPVQKEDYIRRNPVFETISFTISSLYKSKHKKLSLLSNIRPIGEEERWGGLRVPARWPVGHYGGAAAPATSTKFF